MSSLLERGTHELGRARELAQMLGKRGKELVKGAQNARQSRRKRIAAATAAGAAGGAGAYFLNRARSVEAPSQGTQSANGVAEVKDPVTTP